MIAINFDNSITLYYNHSEDKDILIFLPKHGKSIGDILSIEANKQELKDIAYAYGNKIPLMSPDERTSQCWFGDLAKTILFNVFRKQH